MTPERQHIVIRADASQAIGNGHIMRCLTLAATLLRHGGRTTFVCRPHVGHLGARIAAEGHAVLLLPEPVLAKAANDVGQDQPWQEDAEATRMALSGAQVDWLVVGHSGLGADWQECLRPLAAKVMVIDDLANQNHACDLFLDQNLGRAPQDYAGLLPKTSQRLIGPDYALLRPEFVAARPLALLSRAARNGHLRNVLITMGGTDPHNTSGAVLAALGSCLEGLSVTVVLGSNAPHLEKVRLALAKLGPSARLLTDVSDMAALMGEADLAIGAAGGTSWERCCLGLPTLIVVLADNQMSGAMALAKAGAAVLCGRVEDEDWQTKLKAAFLACNADQLRRMSSAAASIVDGKGADRVAKAMRHSGPWVDMRPATLADAEDVWHWRQTMPTEFLESGRTTPLEDHLDWFQRALADPSRDLLIFMVAGVAAGHLRLDGQSTDSAAVSIVLNPDFRGRGLGVDALLCASEKARHRNLSRLTARIHNDNAASQQIFRRAGYVCKTQTKAFSDWEIDLARPSGLGEELP